MARPRKQTGIDQIVKAVSQPDPGPHEETLNQLGVTPDPRADFFLEEKPKERGIEPGDVVQIINKTHKRIAQCPIVHHIDGGIVFAYFPRPGKPEAIQLKPSDVKVIGKAQLRYKKEL
jgi:hypothetical protein